jgi:hypothetical protein
MPERRDRVLVVTTDQKKHRFTIKAIGADRIVGPSESIPLEQIFALEKCQFNRGRTIALVQGLVGGVALGLLIYGLAEYAGAEQAAKALGITQARVPDIKRGKIGQFSLGMLVRLVSRVDLKPKIKLAA